MGAFWREADSSLNLDVFAGITVAGVALHVELYDSNRTKIKDEKKDEEADLKKSPNVDKKVRDVSEKKGTPEGNREYKIENMTVKSEEPKKKDEAGLPKKTAVSKPKEEVVAKSKTSEHKHSEKPPTKSPTPSKNSHETKKHSAKAPETATKGKHPKKDAPDSASTKSPNDFLQDVS